MNLCCCSEHEWRARAREARRADTLATEGGLEGESETRDKYSTKRARRPGMNGPQLQLHTFYTLLTLIFFKH